MDNITQEIHLESETVVESVQVKYYSVYSEVDESEVQQRDMNALQSDSLSAKLDKLEIENSQLKQEINGLLEQKSNLDF